MVRFKRSMVYEGTGRGETVEMMAVSDGPEIKVVRLRVLRAVKQVAKLECMKMKM